MPNFEDLLDTMTNMKDLNPLARIMFYGHPGNGKTVLGMQTAHALRQGEEEILYIDTAQGFTTLQANDRWRSLCSNSTRMKFQGVSQLTLLAQAIQGGDPRFEKFKVLVLDEATIMASRHTVSVAKAKESKASKAISDMADEITWPDRNISYVRFNRMLDDLYACNVHIVLLAHAREDDESRESKLQVTRPAFGPQQIVTVMAPLQLVGYVNSYVTEEKKLDYRVQVRDTRKIAAKTQLDELGIYASYDEVVKSVARFSVETKPVNLLPEIVVN